VLVVQTNQSKILRAKVEKVMLGVGMEAGSAGVKYLDSGKIAVVELSQLLQPSPDFLKVCSWVQ
jgi:lipoate synthase